MSKLGYDSFTLDEWIDMVETGNLIPTDGIGFWVIDGEETSCVWDYPMPPNAQGVHWYNK